ncbi:uncharacterized protein LOC100908638 [Galendromus occidentalis]|uniref:Uncharacterized protein LOC100908638 n=1 Tax=Galendromus occidentalis TaxID=34638 RepID=A0AAJ6QRW1_9ACAR|nr:uncharacterized protein LOC100908638 [Galendromus occidentalis]
MTSVSNVLILLLHRHGMRHPFVHFEGIGEPVTPELLGTLTDRGRLQMAALGRHLAFEHGPDGMAALEPVIPEAIASSVPRCVESSKILFKSFLHEEVNVAVLKTNFADLYHDMIARNIDAMMAHEFRSDQGDRVSDYVNFLNEQANSTKETPWQKYQIVESLLLAKETGHALPPYADEKTLEKCLNIMNRQLIRGFEEILFAEIVHDIAARLRDLPNVRTNFVEYSLSDINIVPVLERLGLGIDYWPGYGSGFEIRISADGAVVLDELRNSADAEISERLAIRKTRLQKLRRKIADGS